MRTSDAGLFALALHEGIVPAPYLDSVGVLTYGIGHTAAAGDPDPATMPRGMPADIDAAIKAAIDLFRRDLAKYEAAVSRAVNVPLKQHQFDALVSFHFNTGAIGRAALTRRLNAGDYAGATSGFMAWVKPESLRARRVAERELFYHGTYPGGTVPVWSVTPAGRVVWKVVRRLTMPQFLAIAADQNPIKKNPVAKQIVAKQMVADQLLASKPVGNNSGPDPVAKGFWGWLISLFTKGR